MLLSLYPAKQGDMSNNIDIGMLVSVTSLVFHDMATTHMLHFDIFTAWELLCWHRWAVADVWSEIK